MPTASSGATWARLVMFNVAPRSGVRNPGKQFDRNVVLDSGRIALRIEGVPCNGLEYGPSGN